MKTKNLILSLIAIVGFSIETIAQNFQWAKSIGGTSDDYEQSMVVDASGNVYTTGVFTGVVDFDPGSGTYNLTSAGAQDVFISKLDTAGNFVWAKRMGGTNGDYGYSIAIDASGNVYTTGFFGGTGDFNPGSGTFNLTSVGAVDIFISKLDASGNFVWANRIGGNDGEYAISIAVDASGNVYTTGSFSGIVDFNPGAGTDNLTSTGASNIFVSKLDATGNFVWAKSLGGGTSGNNSGQSIAVDVSGNVYTTGMYNGTADFDPGSGTYNLTTAAYQTVFISKLDISGNFVWAKSLEGTANNTGFSLTLDGNDNAYITGHFTETVDFDPGSGTYNLTSAGAYDIFILKLDALVGNFVWAKRIGSTSFDGGNSITVDAFGNVYLTGFFQGTVDFDPGGGSYSLTSPGSQCLFILKIDAAGSFLWAKNIGSNGFVQGHSIAVDASGDVYTSGSFSGTGDFDSGSATYNLTSAGSEDIFVTKLCSPPAPTGLITGPSSVCKGATATYSISAVSGANGYWWNVPQGAIINSGQNTTSINVTFATFSGNVEVILGNSCVCSGPSPLSVIVIVPIVGASASPSLTVCPGSTITLSGTGASTYTWSSGITNGIPFIPSSPQNSTINYTVTGTDTNGCINTYNVTVAVSQLPIVGAVASPSATICVGSSVSLSGTGAASYMWNGGVTNGISFVPLSTTTYTVSGTAGNGCINTDTISIIVNPLPTVDATAYPSLIVCNDAAISLNGTGGFSYAWSDGIINGIPFIPDSSTTYTVTGTDTNGCTSVPVPISILVSPSPAPIITAEIVEANYGNNGTITITVNPGLPPYTYDWSIDGIGDWDDSTNQTGLSEGIYTLIVSDQYGCRDTIDATIYNGDEILIPTGISPNGDGFNDKWVILGIDQFKDIQVSIFNLQGQCIYNQKKQYTPWDGLYNGALVPVSDYYYVIESVIKKKKLTGTITVKY